VETFGQSLKEVLGPLADLASWFSAQIFAPDDLKYFLWLVASLIAIDLFYRCWSRPEPESFWSYSAPWRIYSHPSALLEYRFVIVGKLVNALILAPMIVSALALGNWGSKLLVSWLGPGPAWTPRTAALVAFGVFGVLLSDAGHYISHYIQHKVPFFWEFHKVHHTAEVLTPITGFREHPVGLIVDSVFQSPFQAVGLALFSYLYGSQHVVMTFVGINAIVFFFFVLDNVRHSHLWVSFGPKLEHILTSPAMHQVHHSTAQRHLDRNLAQYFAFLDWMAGTLYVPQGQEELVFGLIEGPDPELTTVWGLYWVPLKRAFRLLLPSTAPRPQSESI
jgi:sterol desaturase/sphingolipid hydroxylase (fatty acid hydroxylase superfamily)